MNSGFFVSVSGVQEMKYSSCTVAIFGCVGRRPVRSVYGNWAKLCLDTPALVPVTVQSLLCRVSSRSAPNSSL